MQTQPYTKKFQDNIFSLQIIKETYANNNNIQFRHLEFLIGCVVHKN